MFFDRSASRGVTPSMPLSAPTVSDVSGTECTWNSASESSSSGFAAYPAFCRLRSLNASLLTISVPPFGRSPMFVFSAAGFIATSTFGASPGVRMSKSAKWSWKPETPGSEPAGARISAGKSGSVEMSFPRSAVSEVNCEPVSCMPSPESPAKRTITCDSCSTGLATGAYRVSPGSGIGEQRIEVDRLGEHRRLPLGVERPFALRPVVIELDAVLVRIAQIQRDGDAVIARSVEADSGGEDATERIGEGLSVGIPDGGVVEARRVPGRGPAALRLPRVQSDVVVVAAGGDERGLLAVAGEDVEPQDADVEAERALEVGHLQVHVPDVHAGIDRHQP